MTMKASLLNHPAVYRYPPVGQAAKEEADHSSPSGRRSTGVREEDDSPPRPTKNPPVPHGHAQDSSLSLGKGPVVYWMSRDQRAQDNRALEFALALAASGKKGLVVCFSLVPRFLEAPIRAYDFLLRGLLETASTLQERGIPFCLLLGEPSSEVPRLLEYMEASACVTDFDPLRVKRNWQEEVAKAISLPFYVVDAHNIVPCREASNKQEYSARTIRPKIHSRLERYLREDPWVTAEEWAKVAGFSRGLQGILAGAPTGGNEEINASPTLTSGCRLTTDPNIGGQDGNFFHSGGWYSLPIELKRVLDFLQVDRTVPPVDWIEPGYKAGRKVLEQFIRDKLSGYDRNRDDPNKNGISELSPYLHFGHISAREVALAVERSDAPKEDKEAYLEQLIVRKELSDNFCYYNPHYDSFDGFPSWAQRSLREHQKDPREYVYTYQQFDAAQTHDPLWNAAQNQLVKRGKLHGFLRMYWAKKILEWTPSAEVAMEYAVRLNDRYNLDGRDPNGYVGCAWSIGGVHDRPWFERPVFGMVRYMSYSGAARKFDVAAFIDHWR